MEVLQALETGEQILERLRGRTHPAELRALLAIRTELLARVGRVPTGLNDILQTQHATIQKAMASRRRRLAA